MKRQSVLVWIVVMTAGTSVYSADWQLDWVDGGNIPISWDWSIYPSHFPPFPYFPLPGRIPFSGPTGVFSNDCYAEANLGGTPTITIDPNQKTIELWFQPPAPGACPAIAFPVCGLNGWFGPLSDGDWLFFSNQIPSPYGSFHINFHVGLPLPTLTILNPNGNERLLGGSIYTIRWEDSRSEGYCGGNYLLDYSIDNGNSWIPVASNTISNTCSYDWLVPSIDTNQCLVRITDADDPNINDTSNRPFYISYDLAILNPNGNERLLRDSIYTIRWKDSRSECCSGNYLLDYSIDDGNTWIPVDSNTISNTCSYDWLVPSIDANQCLVRITDADDPNFSDTSDDSFRIYLCMSNVLGDWNGDCYTDFDDFSIIAAGWYVPGGTDINDLATLVQYWLDCANPYDPSCNVREAMPDFPADGTVIVGNTEPGPYGDYIWTELIFIPGATAVGHKGYFNEDYSKVESRHPDANLGSPPYAHEPGWEYAFFVGNPHVPPAVYTLVRGQKYYWTVDSNDALGNTFAGEIWEFAIQDFWAMLLKPPDGATIDDRTPALEWIPGVNAAYHELYFSENFDDVNNRNPAVKQVMTDPCRPYPMIPQLELGRTYYWLVDEVKMNPPERWDARTVWSFTISECLSLDDDGFINFKDYAIPSNDRQKTGPILPADSHNDDLVDYKDLRILIPARQSLNEQE